ncbi:MAG: pirin family protein [Saprospiraceae bacterium]|jgi:redox-sensitive bicupin YhaK (pirin superfamily)|nr:pirin family protein [Saprospiraceae bacterium]HQU95370.1 pirin family protein [Saprospiraceae bacterium]HQW96010.1 pirin family protein [Saprospiraceae bacterium]HRG44174.1 pirin family protein [Saprospiraceae bacterium]
MTLRKIQMILKNDSIHMVGDGFRVNTFFPSDKISIQRLSPFLLLDYNEPVDFSPRESPRGVGVHPHRGFETVTIAYQGSVAHHDSAGNSGVINPGEVQWMTAGSGILHKEYHEKEFSRQGGVFHMVQLWVNLPKAFKNENPGYQKLTPAEFGYFDLEGGKGKVEIIAGEFNGVKSAAKTFSPINLMNIHLKKDAKLTVKTLENWNTAALMVHGSANVNGQNAENGSLVLFENIGEEVEFTASEDVTILFMSGEPIHEPVAAYGPFVMNTHEELEMAYQDFNRGKYGYLED